MLPHETTIVMTITLGFHMSSVCVYSSVVKIIRKYGKWRRSCLAHVGYGRPVL
jgi:hypothetical protein